jgi:two-component system sensor histidine kinase YesM
MKKKMKLTTIIVASFVTVFALFILGLSLMSYKIFFDFTSQEISTARLALLNENTKKVSNFNTGISEAASYIAANRTLIETFSNPVESNYKAIEEQRALVDLLNVVASLKRGIHSIELYTDRYDQHPRISTGVIYQLDDIKQEDWYSLFEKMDNGWLPKHTSKLGHQPIVSYVHRLVNHRGSTVGYVKVNVLDDTFFSNLTDEDVDNPSDEFMIVLNSGGRIISQKFPEDSSKVIENITRPVASEPYRALAPEYDKLSNHHQVLINGNERYLLLISKPNYDRWRLVQLIPVDTLYAKTKELGWLVLMLGLGGLLLSVPLAYWVGKRIIKPILKIIQGMRHVEIGRFDVKIEPHYIEEYDILARNFNHMITELDQSLTQLKSENRARRDAELRTLQNQITPHFLYNTLDIIHWKALDHKAEDISQMVNQLSKMFRIGLSGGKTFITLRHELEHANCFVQIQSLRLNQTIDYDVRVPAGIKEYYVPKIVLQPFIENSMRHGYPFDFKERIHIQVSAQVVTQQKQAFLECLISDNGVGLPEGWQLSNTQGIGIKNVQERIWMYCGRAFAINVYNREEGGTSVCIRLPVIENESDLNIWLEREKEWFDGHMKG